MKKLGFGLMRLPVIDGKNNSIDLEAFKQMADAYIEQGFTYFDTAYPYHGGMSENAVKTAVVDRYPRNSFLLADKMPMFSVTKKEQLESIFKEQLEKCGVEYFDYYLLHSLGNETFRRSEELGAFEFIAEKKAEGKIRHIGFSFHDKAEVLDEMLERHPEMEFVQLQINYLDWDDEGIQAGKCYEVARKHGKDIIVMEPIKGGALANLPEKAAELIEEKYPGKSAASFALKFAASHEGVIMVLSGMSNMEQLRDNMAHMKDFEPLDAQGMALAKEAAKIISSTPAIACTGCKYCIDGCPCSIPIPDYFSVYNNYMRYPSQRFVSETYYENLVAKFASPADCIGCGQCEGACPQHLEITKLLSNVRETFE